MASTKARNPMVTLLFYSIMMVTLPITSFFVSQYAVEHFFEVPTTRSNIYATAVSVILIHVILGIFVYSAYKEDKVVPIAEKED